MKRIKPTLIFILLLAVTIGASAVDELGCCSNPGAGISTCVPDADGLVRRDGDCCPKPEADFPNYYKSSENPFGPADYSNCIINYFAPLKSCSAVSACALGCCCSSFGGEIKSEAQCKAVDLTFHKGQTNCTQLCPTPQCNDAIDNDNNGCADFDGGDTGCTTSADTTESGGTCAPIGADCGNINHVPKLSNLEITPVKGERKFYLRWKDECSNNINSYDILRCKGSNCTNFDFISTSNVNSFEDSSGDLLADAFYTYLIKAKYNLQTATPSINKSAMLGNLECINQFSQNYFCIHQYYYNGYQNYLSSNFPEKYSSDFATAVKNNFGSKFNKAYSCDAGNRLMPEGTSCAADQACVVNNNKPSCIKKSDCNYDAANPFGLYYTLSGCETNKYCFYDKSHSPINSCFGCDPSMSCYDYRTEETCNRDKCSVANCKWKPLAGQIGTGVCIRKNEYNCQWCNKEGTGILENLRSYNKVFDSCTEEKAIALSDGSFKCHYKDGSSKNCDNTVCTDYSVDECSSSKIIHDEYNRITNPSQDGCGIKVCQNFDGACFKNSDGDNQADCTEQSCESDYFAPNTTLIPLTNKGVVGSMLVQVYDKTGINGSVILKTSLDYSTFLCVEPCGTSGHPYIISTASRSIIVSNLYAYDGLTGTRLLSFKEGDNVIRYYSQDPAKNIGEVKKYTIAAFSNSSGPKIFSVNVTGAKKILDKFYTNNKKPTIKVTFFEPAIVTTAQLVDKKTGYTVTFPITQDSKAIFDFSATESLPDGQYTFQLNAKNEKSIFMDVPLSQAIKIDTIKPTVSIVPSNGTLLNDSQISIELKFNEGITMDLAKIDSVDVKDKLTTLDNQIFQGEVNLSDGNKRLDVSATDFAGNKLEAFSFFVIDAQPTQISLASPRYGTASSYTFDLAVETDNDAVCRYSMDNDYEFDYMEQFAETGKTLHKTANFNKIKDGDTTTHKLNVKCEDSRFGLSTAAFSINVDKTSPQIKTAFAFPNPVTEIPSNTTLKIETSEPTICRYSTASSQFGSMEGKFDDYDRPIFKTINTKMINFANQGDYVYYVACINKAELGTETEQISITVDLSIPISVTSHTPEYFNSTEATLAVLTTKRSQCKYSETDPEVTDGQLFGPSGYSHTKDLILAAGTHTFYVICRDQYLQQFSDVLRIKFTIDLTPPIILNVNDSSTIPDKPEFTWQKDSLQVKWNSIENESKLGYHLYSLIDSSISNTTIDWTTSYTNNQWVLVTKTNDSRLNLINGNRYFFRVKAFNAGGLGSDIMESDGITIDTSLKPTNCTNGIIDESESDVDCGARCQLCDLGKKCISDLDCRTNFCSNSACTTPTCNDNAKNQEEGDIDCGGPCGKCPDLKTCNADQDCLSNFCSIGLCKVRESCFDGEFSLAESDVDCGGPCTTKCSEGMACERKEDCAADLECSSSKCRHCVENDSNCNGIPDQQETADIDTDGDGIPNDWEIKNGLDPNNPSDANQDKDEDSLTNSEEFANGTDPNNKDSDNDGFTDKEEIDKGTDPNDPEDFPKSRTGLYLIFGLVILIAGAGYLAYMIISRRHEEFELQKPRQMQRMAPMQRQQPQQKIKPQSMQKEISLKSKEEIRKVQEQREKEKHNLFKTFEGKEKEEHEKQVQSSTQKEKPEEKDVDDESSKGWIEIRKKPQRKVKKSKKAKEPKEDVFSKLKEMANK